MLSGSDKPDTGQVSYRKGIRVSFLEQEPEMDPDLTIEETIFASDNEVLKVIASYERALANPDDQDAYQEAFEGMEHHQAWDFETQYKQILFKLKLEDLDVKVGLLSGGQQKRLALANALINKPELLILDEPTNHLDLEMIEWLELYFAKENMTLFMVTHDRFFLERVCNEIIELDNGKLYPYKGNYSYYLEKKEARIEQEAVEHHKTKILFKKELTWMRRQPKARTTKSKSRIDDFTAIKEKASQRRKEHEIQLEINMQRVGSKILELHKISKAYPNLPILDKFEYTFLKGERIGIIGKNGTGKSTFLNILTGADQPDSGKVVKGETIKFGYYTQKGIEIKKGQKVIDVIREFGDYIPLMKGRQISAQQLLERFLFDRKKSYDFVEKLSGGERKRLYLCTILIQNPNFLILDEPTNDLDIVTLNVLESFLGNAVVEDFPGNYSDYRAYEDSSAIEIRAGKEKAKEKSKELNAAKNTWKKEDKGNKLSYSEQQEYKKLEKEIKKLEFKKGEIEEQFVTGDLSVDEITELSKNLSEINVGIETKTERWFELSAIME
ncbi:putative ABC transporter ATP-binding protein YfmR [Nymphon striatum]|nr:putative ABC transporter ATP-binding protein YfmR [Nymphon striatum]